MIQWLRICLPIADVGSILIRGTKIPQARATNPACHTRGRLLCNKDPMQPKRKKLKKKRMEFRLKIKSKGKWESGVPFR